MSKMNKKEVKVGIGILVMKDPHLGTRNQHGKVLVGVRKGSHAAGLVSFPGGGQEYGETIEEAAMRELEEECGPNFKVKIRPFDELRLELCTTNDYMPEYDKHYITIFLVADWISGEPVNMEPSKCEGWQWNSYDELLVLDQHKQCANWIPMRYITAFRSWIGF